jgi:RNA polymerase-binding protein DksA
MEKEQSVKDIRKILEEKRAVLLSRIRVKHNQPNAGGVFNPDRSDLAQDYFLKERQSALVDHLEDTLEQVEAALQKLDEGTYGQCSQCGQGISPERLAILPYANLCVDCQEQPRNGT